MTDVQPEVEEESEPVAAAHEEEGALGFTRTHTHTPALTLHPLSRLSCRDGRRASSGELEAACTAPWDSAA